MVKRAREEPEAGGLGLVKASSAAPAPPDAAPVLAYVAECEYCLQVFQPHGLTAHQRGCKAKAEWQGESPPPRQMKSQLLPLYRPANKKQKLHKHEAFLQSLSPAYAAFAKSDGHLKRASTATLEECKPRFDVLMNALKQRGVEVPEGSDVCSNFVASGRGDLGEVVDSAEELAFLLGHTDYFATITQRLEEGREEIREETEGWLPSENDDELVYETQLNAKARLCVEFLRDNKGLAIPRKWESYRPRLEEVRAAGNSPTAEHWSRYIYRGPSDESDESDESDF